MVDQSKVLFDTEDAFDAGSIGHDGPTDIEDGGLQVTMDKDHGGPTFTFNGPEGEVTLRAPEAAYLAKVMLDQLRYAKEK